MKTIGVLALQGAFAEHINILKRLGAKGVELRVPGDFDSLDGLIIPGGESTTISRLIDWYRLNAPIKRMASDGKPILGTCAGMIVLAKDAGDSKVNTISVMDITVKRNAFGRQVDSFEADLDIPVLGDRQFRGVFIRAPIIESVGRDVTVLATLNDTRVIAARQGKLIACAFHPELTDDYRFHQYFLELVNTKNSRFER